MNSNYIRISRLIRKAIIGAAAPSAVFVLALSFVPSAPAATAQGRPGQNPACSVLTPAEVATATGYSGYRNPSPGDPPGQGAGGGASCQYSGAGPSVDAKGNPIVLTGPLVSLVLIEGKDYTRKLTLGAGCKREAVSGVGDEAFFEVCPSRLSRTPPLYVKAGSKDLIIQIDIEKPDTDATMRPKAVALAKVAAAKLR